MTSGAQIGASPVASGSAPTLLDSAAIQKRAPRARSFPAPYTVISDVAGGVAINGIDARIAGVGILRGGNDAYQI